MRDPAPREVAGPGLTVASDKPPRQVPHGAVGASTPGFSASEAAWPTRTHSHPMAYFVHVLKRATSLGSQNPRVLAVQEPSPRGPGCGQTVGSNTVSAGPSGACRGRGRCAVVPGRPVVTVPTLASLFCSAAGCWRPPVSASARPLLLSSPVGLARPPGSGSAAGSPAFGTSAADSSCGHAAARGQPHRLAAASPTRPGLPQASPSRTSPIRGPAPRESASTALALHTGSPANCQPWPHEQGAAVSHGAHRYHLGPRPDPAAARVTVPLFKPRHHSSP